MARFERLREMNDLEEVISRQRDAVGLTPDGHPDKPGRLSDLGHSFWARFECLGKLRDLGGNGIRLALLVTLTSPGDWTSSVTFWTCYKRFRELGDLEETISSEWDAVSLA